MFTWQDTLGNFLSYFGDQRLEDGLKEAVTVAIARESVHREYITALEAGIASAARGERDVIEFLWSMMLIDDPAEAKIYLEEVLAKYLALYDEAQKKNAGLRRPSD